MKCITIVLMIIFFSFCYGGEVLAAGFKPPSAVCFNLQGGEILTLTIKAMGKATMADGSTQFYSINGVLFNQGDLYGAPLTGTGYMSKGQSNRIFNFEVVGSVFSGSADHYRYSFLGHWDVVVGSGEMFGSSSGLDHANLVNMTINTVDCKAQTIPPNVLPPFPQ